MSQPQDSAIEFDCPFCSGAFEAPAELLGQEVECPHCNGVVELPHVAAESEAESPASAAAADNEPRVEMTNAPAVEPEPGATPAEPETQRPLTRQERDARRRRLNLLLALAGGVILLLAFVVLASIPR